MFRVPRHPDAIRSVSGADGQAPQALTTIQFLCISVVDLFNAFNWLPSLPTPHNSPNLLLLLLSGEKTVCGFIFLCVGPIRVADRWTAKGNWLFINASDDLIEPLESRGSLFENLGWICEI